MGHFTLSQWTDYVRGLVAGDEQRAMDLHLTSHCSRCAEMTNLLRQVVVASQNETEYEPPDGSLRRAEAIYEWFQPERPSLTRLVANLVRDSWREPIPAGMRGRDRLSHHALYEAGNFYLDLQVEQRRPSGLVSLTGQVADRNQSATGHARVPVLLMARKNLVTSTVCNGFGEFQLDYSPSRNLRLCLPLGESKRQLEISLDELSPPPPGRPRSPKRARRAP